MVAAPDRAVPEPTDKTDPVAEAPEDRPTTTNRTVPSGPIVPSNRGASCQLATRVQDRPGNGQLETPNNHSYVMKLTAHGPLLVVVVAAALGTTPATTRAGDRALNSNAGLQEKAPNGASPAGFTLEGDAVYGEFPDRQSERAGRGVRLLSGRDKNGDGVRRGSLSQTVSGISAKQGRWFRFRVRGLVQDGFHVQRDALFLKVDFFRDGGTNSLDHLQKSLYGQVAQERR